MQKKLINHLKTLSIIAMVLGLILYGCSSKDLVDFNYPDQVIYMPQASIAASSNGIYSITPSIQGLSYRYLNDVTAGKCNVPLGILRSGTDLSGLIPVDIALNTDTVSKLIASGRFAVPTDPTVTTEQLPAAAFTLPTIVNVPGGSSNESFNVSIDLNFLLNSLLNTPKKRYALAVGISATGSSKNTNPRFGTTVILVDPQQMLIPVANFTSYIFRETRTANFVNTSSNGTTYSWNYGDGSPVSSEVAASHVYLPGTYTVTLTTTGIPGVSTASVKSTILVIQ